MRWWGVVKGAGVLLGGWGQGGSAGSCEPTPGLLICFNQASGQGVYTIAVAGPALRKVVTPPLVAPAGLNWGNGFITNNTIIKSLDKDWFTRISDANPFFKWVSQRRGHGRVANARSQWGMPLGCAGQAHRPACNESAPALLARSGRRSLRRVPCQLQSNCRLHVRTPCPPTGP